MNDERFFDLAMKVIARQCTDAERAELDAMLAQTPELRAEFARLEADASTTKDVLPLVEATQATEGELPGYARGRLQTKVREVLGSHRAPLQEKQNEFAWGWRWAFGLAATAAVVLLVALPMFRSPDAPVIQVAMLDTTGATRGPEASQAALLQQTWSKVSLEQFSDEAVLRDWESRTKPNTVKVIYNHAAAELKVVGSWRGRSFEKTFVVGNDLKSALDQAQAFIREQTAK